jgi:nucleoside phosphorylase
MKYPVTSENFIDHILEYDPEDISTASKYSSLQPALMEPRNLTPIPWPKNLAPRPRQSNKKPNPDSPLPECDYLIVTWTVAEALALSDILTPGYRSKTDWYSYTHLFNLHYKPIIKKGAPSLKSKRLGSWFRTEINKKSVLCFKSELHLARDGSKLPIKDLWEQLISEVKPQLIISTGTAGAIGKDIMLGDVVVTNKVRFDCNHTFKEFPFNNKEYTSKGTINTSQFNNTNKKLLKINADMLPSAIRTPKIIYKTSDVIERSDVVTTDFFAYDNSTDTFKLQSLGAAVEMGDAVLGLVCDEMGSKAPDWLMVRNASDPQIDGTLSTKEQIQMAARIYEKYGYWTTVESAIVCWALIA